MCNSICARRFTARLQSVMLVAKHYSTSAAFWPAWRTLGLILCWIHLKNAPKGARLWGFPSSLAVNSTQALVDTMFIVPLSSQNSVISRQKPLLSQDIMVKPYQKCSEKVFLNGRLRDSKGSARGVFLRRKHVKSPPAARGFVRSNSFLEATWLILPVVICLSQRLSHACLSTN